MFKAWRRTAREKESFQISGQTICSIVSSDDLMRETTAEKHFTSVLFSSFSFWMPPSSDNSGCYTTVGLTSLAVARLTLTSCVSHSLSSVTLQQDWKMLLPAFSQKKLILKLNGRDFRLVVVTANLSKAKVPARRPAAPPHFPSDFKQRFDGGTQEIPSFLLLCCLQPRASVIDIKSVLFDQ